VANVVIFDYERNNSGVDLSGNAVTSKTGLPQEDLILLHIEDMKIQLVHLNKSASQLIGYQILIRCEVIAKNLLYCVFGLGIRYFLICELKVPCR
jgi:hypothetical protein